MNNVLSYDRQTLHALNPIARYAHRNRLRCVKSIIMSQNNIKKILDYGCGNGAFIKTILGIKGIEVVGYEPFMAERVDANLPIFRDFSSIEAAGPFDIITVLETIEHLKYKELLDLLKRADSVLTEKGRILFSAPIEIGPALLIKELNRCILYKHRSKHSKYSLTELFLASFFGIPAKHPENMKHTHKGFDFRKKIRFLKKQYGPVKIIFYGPLPIGTWYGNSQVYFWLTRRSTPKIRVHS